MSMWQLPVLAFCVLFATHGIGISYEFVPAMDFGIDLNFGLSMISFNDGNLPHLAIGLGLFSFQVAPKRVIYIGIDFLTGRDTRYNDLLDKLSEALGFESSEPENKSYTPPPRVVNRPIFGICLRYKVKPIYLTGGYDFIGESFYLGVCFMYKF